MLVTVTVALLLVMMRMTSLSDANTDNNPLYNNTCKYTTNRTSFNNSFPCPKTCVWLYRDMCRGVNWCNIDVQECDYQLRCNKIPLQSNLTSEHFYCLDRINENNQAFDSLDRSDELKIVLSKGNASCLQYNNYTHHAPRYNLTNSSDYYDYDYSGYYYYELPEVMSYSRRCSGARQECFTPWYTKDDGYRKVVSQTSTTSNSEMCQDKSDQVFKANLTCLEHLHENLEFHDAHFCKSPILYPVQYEAICRNIGHWLNEQDPSFSDPHNCKSSCSDSSRSLGLQCKACTNSEYFNCTSEKICLHPQLVCDGHPQCAGGEDENLEKCRSEYVRNHVIGREASYKCTSKFYDNMMIYATPCNKIIECDDGSDETGCKDNKTTNIFLGFFTAMVFFLFLVLRYCNPLRSEKKTNNALQSTDVLRTYKFRYEDQESIDLVNLHILNSMKRESVVDHNELCVKYFNLEARLNNKKEPETYLSLHKRLDPTVAKTVVDEKFPGCLDGLKSCIEKASCRREWITRLTNWVTRTEWAKKLIANIIAAATIEFKFLDLYKDLGLSILMLKLVGGPQALVDNPTYFSTAMVMAMFVSVCLPIVTSSIHLLVNSRHMLMRFVNLGTSRLRRVLIGALLVLFAPFHPVLLDYLHLVTSEEARTLIQNYDPVALQLMQECRRIQIQNANLLKIELGNYKNTTRPTVQLCQAPSFK